MWERNIVILPPRTASNPPIGIQSAFLILYIGLRIMTFGILFDFTGNSNVSKIIKAADMVKQDWFLAAVTQAEPIDVFLLIGHNPIRTTDYANTFGLVHSTIRALRSDIPIQIFGGHSHIRDFQVYDDKSTGLESGKLILMN